MTEANNCHDCKTLRSSLETKLDSGAQLADLTSSSEIEKQLSSCASCRVWCEHTMDLIAAASVIPQFDVPEALTQRILVAVETERKASITVKEVVLTAIVLGLTVAFVALESFESVSGLLAWFAGVAAVAVLKVVLTAPSASGEVAGS